MDRNQKCALVNMIEKLRVPRNTENLWFTERVSVPQERVLSGSNDLTTLPDSGHTGTFVLINEDNLKSEFTSLMTIAYLYCVLYICTSIASHGEEVT